MIRLVRPFLCPRSRRTAGLSALVGVLLAPLAPSSVRAQVPVEARVSSPAGGWEAPAVGDYVTVRVHAGRAAAASPLRFVGFKVLYDPAAYTRVSEVVGPLTQDRDFDGGDSEGLLLLRHDENISGSGRNAFSYSFALFDSVLPVDGRVAVAVVLRVRAALPAERYGVSVEEVELRDAAGALVAASPSVAVESRPVSGSAAGWRLVSVPATGATVATLAALNLVQGVGVAGQPGAEFAGFSANLYTGYTGRAADAAKGFTIPSATTDALTPGRGVLWYLFDRGGPDPSDSRGTSRRAPLPLTFAATAGPPPIDGVAVSFTSDERAGATNGFYLLGNPFAWSYDLSGVRASAGLLSDVFHVYDAATGWKTLMRSAGPESLSDGTAADDIAPWQGVFAEVTGPGGAPFVPEAGTPLVVTFESAAAATAPAFVGKNGAAADGSVRGGARIAFTLDGTFEGRPLVDASAALFAGAGADLGWDRYDASKLDPLTGTSVALALGGDRAGAAAWLAQRSIPDRLDAPLTVPLRLSVPGPIRLTLRWYGEAGLPIAAELVDASTSVRTDLRTSAVYTFDAVPADSLRFSLRLSPLAATGAAPGLSAFDVSAPVPNPARGASARVTVRSDVAESAHVTVYDVLGREVVRMAAAPVTPGVPLYIDIPLAPMGAGVYVVRVQSDHTSTTRTLTVLR